MQRTCPQFLMPHVVFGFQHGWHSGALILHNTISMLQGTRGSIYASWHPMSAHGLGLGLCPTSPDGFPLRTCALATPNARCSLEGLALGEPVSAEGGRASFSRGRLALPMRLVTSALPKNDGDCDTARALSPVKRNGPRSAYCRIQAASAAPLHRRLWRTALVHWEKGHFGGLQLFA